MPCTASEQTDSIIAADDINTNTSSTPRPKAQRRHSSFDDETMRNLEKQLSHRPEKQDLIERNILKGHYTQPTRCSLSYLIRDDVSGYVQMIASHRHSKLRASSSRSRSCRTSWSMRSRIGRSLRSLWRRASCCVRSAFLFIICHFV